MKLFLKLLFGGILIAMLSVTVMASLDRSVFTAGADLWRDPWGKATLFDAYCGFLTFFVWVAYKEKTNTARLLWFVLIMAGGNIAMSIYVLRELFRLKPGEPLSSLFLKHS